MAEPRFQPNVEALQLVIPADIPPEQIEVRLGTHWIPPPDANQFLAEVLDAEEPRWSRSGKQFFNFTSPYLRKRLFTSARVNQGYRRDGARNGVRRPARCARQHEAPQQ